ncbi:hypothetical protein VY88_33145 [Azospirillum thiophilum]|nr:hypothetical protein VY88_33145 [Azospirillum thiophilum]
MMIPQTGDQNMAQMSRAEQQRANEIQDYLRGLGAREAAAIAPRLTAGLSAGAASAIQHTAQRRVNQTRDIAQEWTEADTRQQRLESRRLDEFRQRQQARQQAEQRREQDYQAWVRLQQFCDDMRRMNDRQVKAHFTAAMTDDRTFAAARESLRAALVAQSTEAFLLRKRQAALANGTPPADVATFDMLRSMLSGDQMKTIIREALIDARPVADEPPAVAAVKAAGARETIEQRLMAVLDVSNAALTSEQRRAFETSIRSSLLDHFQEFGLSAGVALTVAEIEAHAESLRAVSPTRSLTSCSTTDWASTPSTTARCSTASTPASTGFPPCPRTSARPPSTP